MWGTPGPAERAGDRGGARHRGHAVLAAPSGRSTGAGRTTRIVEHACWRGCVTFRPTVAQLLWWWWGRSGYEHTQHETRGEEHGVRCMRGSGARDTTL